MKILLIQFKPAGDVLLLSPAAKALKQKYPQCRITFMVNEKESVVLKNNPHIDNFILIKKTDKKSFAGYLRYIRFNFAINRHVRREKFDAIIDFIGNPKSATVCFFSCARRRIGRRGVGLRSVAYNVKIDGLEGNVSTVTKRLHHLKPLGIDCVYLAPEIYLSDEDKIFAKEYFKNIKLAKNRKIVFLAPNSPRSSRRWKAEYFAEAGKALQKKYKAKILLAWGPGEEDYTEKIRDSIGGDAALIPLTTLTQMAALIAKSSLIITNDSGAKHLANALGVSSITIYGPTNPYAWNSPDMKKNPAIRADVPCIQCEKRVCPLEQHLCMEAVTPDMVVNAAKKLL